MVSGTYECAAAVAAAAHVAALLDAFADAVEGLSREAPPRQAAAGAPSGEVAPRRGVDAPADARDQDHHERGEPVEAQVDPEAEERDESEKHDADEQTDRKHVAGDRKANRRVDGLEKLLFVLAKRFQGSLLERPTSRPNDFEIMRACGALYPLFALAAEPLPPAGVTEVPSRSPGGGLMMTLVPFGSWLTDAVDPVSPRIVTV